MDPILANLLKDHDELSPLCNSTDVAGIAVERGDAFELITARITAGSRDVPPASDVFHIVGRWRIFRYLRGPTYLADAARSLSETGQLPINANATYRCADSIHGLHRNDFVQTPDSVFSHGQALITYVGASCGPKTFADLSEYQLFLRLIATSEHYHNVSDLVRGLVLRQAMIHDEARGLRFEIEPALYFQRPEWRPRDVLLHFGVPRNVDISDARVKWQTKESQGIAAVARSGDTCTALISTDTKKLDAIVIYRSFKLQTLYEEDRPQPLAESLDPDIEEENRKTYPDYAKYGTTRRGLRLSIMKQVSRDQALYKIVSRDIEDAIWCLENDKYKLAAILSGGIIEAILFARLARDTPADIQNAFAALYSNKQAPPVTDMKLYQLIAVASKRGSLKESKIYDGIRDWRNFVHPNREVQDGAVDIMAAGIAVNAAVRLLLGKS